MDQVKVWIALLLGGGLTALGVTGNWIAFLCALAGFGLGCAATFVAFMQAEKQAIDQAKVRAAANAIQQFQLAGMMADAVSPGSTPNSPAVPNKIGYVGKN